MVASSKLTATIGQLVTERPLRAKIFESFGIDYCCGGKKPLAQACTERNLDPKTVVGVLDAFDDSTAAQSAQEPDWSKASLNELAAASRHDKGQLSRGVKRLVEAGLLLRETRRGERGVFISPTAEGRQIFEQLKKLAYDENLEVVKGVTPEELEVFNAVLGKIETNARAMMEAELDGRNGPSEPEPEPAPTKARKLASVR